jgi:hypothetical protein
VIQDDLVGSIDALGSKAIERAQAVDSVEVTNTFESLRIIDDVFSGGTGVRVVGQVASRLRGF